MKLSPVNLWLFAGVISLLTIWFRLAVFKDERSEDLGKAFNKAQEESGINFRPIIWAIVVAAGPMFLIDALFRSVKSVLQREKH